VKKTRICRLYLLKQLVIPVVPVCYKALQPIDIIKSPIQLNQCPKGGQRLNKGTGFLFSAWRRRDQDDQFSTYKQTDHRYSQIPRLKNRGVRTYRRDRQRRDEFAAFEK
jgi:hypothetical protein